MSSDFCYEFIQAMKPEAMARIKGGVLRRLFFGGARVPMRLEAPGGRSHVVTEPDRGLRFSRASYMTALGEAAEAFTPEQRDAWRRFGTLPEGFWADVERRAAEWDSLPG
ncbi:MAG TPA: hypothetical protein VF519_17920 [Mycobacteriales bacterium]